MGEITIDVGWVTIICAIAGIIVGIVGGCFTMNIFYEKRYSKQIERCQIVYARKDVIDAKLQRIEMKLDTVKDQVDQIWRGNGFRTDK